MTAIKTADIDRFIAAPDAARPIVLVFGPDAGLVRERVDALVRASVDNPADPFALARIEGEQLAAEPSRLVEEAHTVPLFGGRRAVWVRVGARHNAVPAIEMLIASPAPECRVIIEAGELRKNAPLRMLCEKAKAAAALPCYVDNERDLARLIDEEMRAADLSLAPDARSALTALIGGDRLASRSEMRKLALYARGKNRIDLDDVLAVIADASALALDNVVDAAFAGRTAEVENQFNKARGSGTSPAAIVSAALRQVAALHKMRLAIEDGGSVGEVVEAAVPSGQFRRRPVIEAALKSWTSARLLRAMEQLSAASLEARRQSALAEAIASRALMSLAVNARRKES